MKKLMIAAAAVAFGFAAQAATVSTATVSWMAANITAAGADGNGWSASGTLVAEGTAQIFFYSDAAMTAASAIDVGDAAFSDSWEDGYSDQVTTGSLFTRDPATTYYGKLVITDADGNTLTSDGFQFATAPMQSNKELYIGGTADDIYGSIQKIGGGAFTGDYGVFASSGWVAAPEPTSGLLLLIGVGALALRRKRA